jgi:hypothetical protein
MQPDPRSARPEHGLRVALLINDEWIAALSHAPSGSTAIIQGMPEVSRTARVPRGRQGTTSAAAKMRRSNRSRLKEQFPRSGRTIVIFDRRVTSDLRREDALVYRAGLSNKTGGLVGVRLRDDKLYDDAHLLTKAGNRRKYSANDHHRL